MTDCLHALLTALADDELVLGHRHSEWTGFAPHLEEDVAFSSIAQDEIGHAAAYYSLAARLDGGDPDGLALGRRPHEYRHASICERANRDWAHTVARHWLYDHADDLRLEALSHSAHPELAALARKMRREERYHLLHADAWMSRISGGSVEGRTRLAAAVSELLPEAAGLFEPVEGQGRALERGWVPEHWPGLGRRFSEDTAAALDVFGLPTGARAEPEAAAEFVASSSGDLISDGSAPSTAPQGAALGGRRGVHSRDFDDLWEVMTSQYRAHPGATW